MANIVVKQEGSRGINQGWVYGFALGDGQTVEFHASSGEKVRVSIHESAKGFSEEGESKTYKYKGSERADFEVKVPEPDANSDSKEELGEGNGTALTVTGSGG